MRNIDARAEKQLQELKGSVGDEVWRLIEAIKSLEKGHLVELRKAAAEDVPKMLAQEFVSEDAELTRSSNKGFKLDVQQARRREIGHTCFFYAQA